MLKTIFTLVVHTSKIIYEAKRDTLSGLLSIAIFSS